MSRTGKRKLCAVVQSPADVLENASFVFLYIEHRTKLAEYNARGEATQLNVIINRAKSLFMNEVFSVAKDGGKVAVDVAIELDITRELEDEIAVMIGYTRELFLMTDAARNVAYSGGVISSDFCASAAKLVTALWGLMVSYGEGVTSVPHEAESRGSARALCDVSRCARNSYRNRGGGAWTCRTCNGEI